MSDTQTKDNPIHRLVDMVVEEVSLVDRAANEHRFLIVKRSEPMNPEDAAPVSEDCAENAAETTQATKDAHAGPAPDVITTAVAALEGLTEAVEILNANGGDQARLVELATELQSLATKLAGDEPASEPTAEHSAEGTTPDTASAVESIRSTLSRVESLVNAAAEAKTPEPVNDPEPEPAPEAAPAAANDAFTEQMDAVAKALIDLTTTVQAQHQRIAQVEKRFGIPNSARSDERPSRTAAPALGWPMDMNNPMDRESVDKAVSFHDL